VYDQHDLNPEVFISRFGPRLGLAGRLQYKGLLWLERMTYRLADQVISTNESYRHVALDRGGLDGDRVTVVRSGPDTSLMRPVEGRPELRKGRRHLAVYLGIMGPQDGVDHALRALAALRGMRDDWHAVFVGDGDALPAMRALADELSLGDHVEFAGWRGDDDIRLILSSSDVCLAPDPPSPLNDVSTMIKIPEYMALGRAVASYALPESRVSAGDSALYAAPGDPDSLGRCVAELLDDPARRERMGAMARERIETELSWQHSEGALLAAYARVSRPAPSPAPARALTARTYL
jgi:glycosyltransferase involved in cell wall biosynthesis